MNALPELVNFVEEVANMRFPPDANSRVQDLMDRNNEGLLSAPEREELASLAAISEQFSLIRAHAFLLLGKKPA